MGSYRSGMGVSSDFRNGSDCGLLGKGRAMKTGRHSLLHSACVFVVSILPLVGVATADTTVGGMIAADTHWTVENGPYIVAENLLVVNDATLTIDPGVQVRFDPERWLEVAVGQLVSRGTQADPIRFTANSAGPIADADRWDGIRFGDGAVDAVFDTAGDYSTGSIIEHAIVEYAGETALDLDRAAPYISHSVIQENSRLGIYVDNAQYVKISHCVIQQNLEGAVRTHAADHLLLISNVIANNRGYAIRLAASDFVSMRNNTVSNNTGYGYGTVNLSDCDSLTLQGDRIVDNKEAGFGDNAGILLGNNCWPSPILSASSSDVTAIYGNEGYQLSNHMLFGGSYQPDGVGNVDARNVWWGTADGVEIASGIHDYSDDAGGIVFYDPWALMGDADGSGYVNDDDLSLLLANWVVGSQWGQGDFDGSGAVDDDDLGVLLAHWNEGTPPMDGGAIPEPATLVLLAGGGIALLRRKVHTGEEK